MNKIILSSRKIQNSTEGSWNQILRSGNWENSYKAFKLSINDLDEMIVNFKANVLRQEKNELQVNYGHASYDKAAGWIEDLRLNGKHLEAKIRWTPSAQKAIQEEEYRYFSAEISPLFIDEETGVKYKNVLSGSALTNIPFVAGMKPVTLSNSEKVDGKNLFFNNTVQMDTFKKMLSTLQGGKKCSLDEVALLKIALADLTEEEQAEVKPAVDEVEAKATAEAEAEKAETEKAEAEAKAKADAEAGKEEELSSLKKQVETLSATDKDKIIVDLTKSNEENQKKLSEAQSKLDKAENDARKALLSSELEKLNKEGKVLPKDNAEWLSVLMDSSKTKSDTILKNLQNLPKSVSEVELGKTGAETSEDDSSVMKEAEVRLSKDKTKELHEHITDIYRERELAKK